MHLLTPEQYLAKIKPLRNPDEIKAVCEELTSSLFNLTDLAKTRVNKLTKYNKEIEKIPNEELIEGENAYVQERKGRNKGQFWKRHLHFRYIGLETTNFNDEGGINDVSTVTDKLDNKKVLNVNKYLEVTGQLLLSDNAHELAVGLIGATGRRPLEILARGDFFLCDEIPNYLCTDYFINFRGQAKKRDYEIPLEERYEYRIGVLFPSKFILEAFTRFRLMDESKEILGYLEEQKEQGVSDEIINEKIDDRRGNSLRRKVEKYYKDFLIKRHNDNHLNCKGLRACYVSLIVKRDCPDDKDDLVWAGRALGHYVEHTDSGKNKDSQLTNLITTLGYRDYVVKTKVPFPPIPTLLETTMVTTSQPETIISQPESLPETVTSLPESITQPETVTPLPEIVTPLPEIVTPLPETVISQPENIEVDVRDCRISLETLKLIKQWQIKVNLPNFESAVKKMLEIAQTSESLESELVESQQTIAKLQEERESVATSIPEDELEVTLEKLLKKMLPEILPEYLSTNKKSVTKVTTKEGVQPKSDVDAKDWTYTPSEDLKSTKGTGSSEEKIRRSFEAIKDYNDYKAENNDAKWYIGNQSLRQLSGCNGQIVSDWINNHHLAIEEHNTKHDLKQYHNKRHKLPITEIISW